MPDDRPAGADEARPAAALPLAKRIIGYCDPLSAAPGQEVRVFVSCDPAITSYQAELVRFRATAAAPQRTLRTGSRCRGAPAATRLATRRSIRARTR